MFAETAHTVRSGIWRTFTIEEEKPTTNRRKVPLRGITCGDGSFVPLRERMMASQFDPIPLTFPVALYEMPCVGWIIGTTLDELIALFGQPTGIKDPGDPSPMERWAFQYPCGLQVVYTLSVFYKQSTITADIPEVAHVARHLPFDSSRVQLVARGELETLLDAELRYRPERKAEFDSLYVAQVWRQGDDGNEFTVGEPTSERDARCHVAELETQGHKQLYWYKRR